MAITVLRKRTIFERFKGVYRFGHRWAIVIGLVYRGSPINGCGALTRRESTSRSDCSFAIVIVGLQNNIFRIYTHKLYTSYPSTRFRRIQFTVFKRISLKLIISDILSRYVDLYYQYSVKSIVLMSLMFSRMGQVQCYIRCSYCAYEIMMMTCTFYVL